MGGLMGGGGGGSTTTTSDSTTTDKHFQEGQYGNLLGNADSWLNQAQGGSNPNYTGQMGDILGQMGNQYMGVLTGASDQTALNNALQSQAAQATQSFDRNIMPGLTQSANAAGQSGGSRAGIAEGIARGDLASSIANNQAQTINQFQQQEQANKMAAAQGMSGLFGQVGQLQSNAQANTPEAIRLKQLLAYQQMISGNMGGTTNSTGTSTSTPQQEEGGGLLGTIGTIGGGVVGGMFGGPAGAAAGAGIGGSLGNSLSSDERLKKKIKKKKDKNGKKIKTKDGIDVAEWEWNEKGEEMGLSGKATGVIAQEAEKKRPDVVTKDKKGYRKVNYGALM